MYYISDNGFVKSHQIKLIHSVTHHVSHFSVYNSPIKNMERKLTNCLHIGKHIYTVFVFFDLSKNVSIAVLFPTSINMLHIICRIYFHSICLQKYVGPFIMVHHVSADCPRRSTLCYNRVRWKYNAQCTFCNLFHQELCCSAMSGTASTEGQQMCFQEG